MLPGDRGSRARGAEVDFFFRFFTAGHVVDPWGTGRVGWRGADGEALKAAGGGVLHAPVLTCFAGCCFVQLLQPDNCQCTVPKFKSLVF